MPENRTDSTLTPAKDADYKRFLSEWHLPGCLPDTDVLDWDTAREAWNDLLERLDDSDLMWETDPDEPDKPKPSMFAFFLSGMAEKDEAGVIYGPDGYVYCVTDTAPPPVKPAPKPKPKGKHADTPAPRTVRQVQRDMAEATHTFQGGRYVPIQEPIDFTVGEKDTTSHEQPGCPDRWYISAKNYYMCTREYDHAGVHAAGDGDTIRKVW